MSLKVTPATSENTPALHSILEEARAFKESLGDDIWGPAPFTLEEVDGMVASGNMYVAVIDGEIAVAFALQQSDERMWGPDRGNDGQATYIHRLAVRERFRGQKLGEQILDWAIDRTKEEGRSFVRLDCSYENRGLCTYYERRGFQEVERIDRPKSAGARNPHNPVYRATLYQKRV